MAVILALAVYFPQGAKGQAGTNIFGAGRFDDVQTTYVPWAGVDSDNNIHGIEGNQLMVGDTGNIDPQPFGPSAAVGDLTGNGKPDLVVADTRGFFWYFPNSGTPLKAAFTQGEVIPIYLGEERTGPDTEGFANPVPRIQLVDTTGTGKLDIVAGTYAGKFFRMPNVGTSSQPKWQPTPDRDRFLINTHKHGVLWCNYLAPFMTSAFGKEGILDLVLGEGTYSANSIWLLRNTDTNDHPLFTEDHLTKLAPGMGLEQLTPAVVDWNGDGKPDLICGDRTGYIDLFLNTSTDPANPTFAPSVHVKVGGVEQLGKALTLTICDLNNNHLPNLLIGRDDGTLLYAQNSGTPGHPQFNAPATPVKGVLPPTYHYVKPNHWHMDGEWGQAYELLGCTNPQLEPGFAFPDGVKASYALKFWVWPYKNQFFSRYYEPNENGLTEHVIVPDGGVTLKMNQRYNLHFWVLAPDDSVSDFNWRFVTGGIGPQGPSSPIATGSRWTEVNYGFTLHSDSNPSLKEWGYGFEIHFHGQATWYMTDLQIREVAD